MNATNLFNPGRKKARIEIIPLIDVVFFLLATFVLFTLSLDKIGSIPVPLPRTAEPKPQETTVFIQASDAGTLYWKQGADASPELISASELPAKLADYRHRVAEPRVFIRGDSHARLGPVTLLLDEVRRAGIDRVSVETVPSRTGS